ncbi:response regulator [Pseudomonas sp. zfem005]|uniref:response regulator n=1 Tax=Pseudomonas sp. zfem005 TaxID=3078200 RepID=UPI0029296EA3|nr:response regulator [Pseudomonas sp. zfem005]MDU9410836.1 response regulator [Pseudomonas sp. zfem005]
MNYGDLLSQEEMKALDELVRVPNAQPSVLVVDGDEAARYALAERLLAQGIVCTTAGSAEQALALLLARPSIDLLVTELHLTCGGGLELVREVRQSARADLPVIITSGDADVQDAIEAMRLKVLDFLLKPVDISRLVTLVRNELGAPPAKSPPVRARQGKAEILALKSA